MVLPSNSSMRYFPENTTSSFITELPNTVHLHGEWEVALSEIQFPCSFLHVGHDENVIKFVEAKKEDEKRDERKKDYYFAAQTAPRKVTIPSGIYKNIEELLDALNSACESIQSHFYFKRESANGAKIRIWVNCGAYCGMIHYISFSDKLQQILGCVIHTVDDTNLRATLTLRESEERFYTETFYRFGFINEGSRTRRAGLTGTEPYSLTRAIPDKMFVYCDICESYITGDVRTPLLRIVPVEVHGDNYAYGANLVKYFSPPHYIPLQRTNFCRIEIDIRDKLGKKIPFESGTLTATLHFRRAR